MTVKFEPVPNLKHDMDVWTIITLILMRYKPDNNSEDEDCLLILTIEMNMCLQVLGSRSGFILGSFLKTALLSDYIVCSVPVLQ